MKKSLLLLVLVAATTLVMAQKPVAGSKGFSAGLQGITGQTFGSSAAGTVLFKYYVQESLVLRAGLNFSSINTLEVEDTTDFYGGDSFTQTTMTSKGSEWALELGLEKTLGTSEKLEPYIGGFIYTGGVGGGQSENHWEVLKADPNNTTLVVGDYTNSLSTGSKTSTFGVVGVVGFNYFFTENLSIGAEYGYGWHTKSTKGGEVITESKFGSTTTTDTYTRSENYIKKSSGLGVHPGTITLSWFF